MTGADEAGRGSELVVCVSFHGAADADDTSGACLSVSAHHSRRSYILVCLYSRINKQPHQSRPSPNEKLRHPDKRHKCLQLRLPSFAGGSASRASVATEQASAQSALVKRYGRFAAQPPTRARCRSAASSRPPIRAPPIRAPHAREPPRPSPHPPPPVRQPRMHTRAARGCGDRPRASQHARTPCPGMRPPSNPSAHPPLTVSRGGIGAAATRGPAPAPGPGPRL